MIRRYTWKHVYSPDQLPSDFQDTAEEDILDHIDHCISTLRIAITCTSDVTPVLLRRDLKNPLSVIPDFHTLHKCRDFEKIQRWFISESYTDWDCIQRGGVGCNIIPEAYRRESRDSNY
jgi:hypothetical protein